MDDGLLHGRFARGWTVHRGKRFLQIGCMRDSIGRRPSEKAASGVSFWSLATATHGNAPRRRPLAVKDGLEREVERDFAVSFAFQPIVDIESQQVFAYEALVRGQSGESAGSVFAALDSSQLHVFD